MSWLLAFPLFWSTPICIFEGDIDGPALSNNQLSRNAGITMTNNKFGRFRVTASLPLLALNFLLIGRVDGAMLSHNTLDL